MDCYVSILELPYSQQEARIALQYYNMQCHWFVIAMSVVDG